MAGGERSGNQRKNAGALLLPENKTTTMAAADGQPDDVMAAAGFTQLAAVVGSLLFVGCNLSESHGIFCMLWESRALGIFQ